MAANLMQQLQDEAPQEVLSSILSFAGPSTALAASTLNSSWRRAANHEATYQALSEALQKHKPHSAPPPSWRTFYRENIMVPDDFATVSQAVRWATREFEQAAVAGVVGKRITIWIRPGRHVCQDTLVINNVGKDACLCLNTLPTDMDGSDQQQTEEDITMDIEEEDSMVEEDDSTISSSSSSTDSCPCSGPPVEGATLIMDTNFCNRPLICLQQGTLELNHVVVEHYSAVNLLPLLVKNKNENAAILIKRPDNSRAFYSKSPPTLRINALAVTSYSGKGVMNRSGGCVTVSDSSVARLW